jgi:PIN domain nuclease of toxin-antitoxin system
VATKSNLLLDTHVFLWWREASPRLSPEARDAIAAAPVVFVSAASAWEAAIKQALGRLRLPDRFAAGVEESGFEQLAVTFDHAERAGALPPHHADPFDRMLVAQALAEDLTLVTRDRRLEPYAADVLWA